MAPSNVENFSPYVIKQISRELCDLTKNPLEGIRVVFNEDDVTNVQADIDGPAGTPYYGGIFRVRLILGKNFPTAPPKGFFVTKIFHPNVGKNGEICVNTLKKDWNQDLGIKHILLTIKCLLIVPNPESALNEEAGKMLLEQYEDYCKRAKMMTEIHAPKSGTGGQKQPLDGICCSEEPATKRLNSILDCYNSTNDQGTQPTSQTKSVTSESPQQSSSQSSKISTSSTISNKNRGLKRVLRLRS